MPKARPIHVSELDKQALIVWKLSDDAVTDCAHGTNLDPECPWRNLKKKRRPYLAGIDLPTAVRRTGQAPASTARPTGNPKAPKGGKDLKERCAFKDLRASPPRLSGSPYTEPNQAERHAR